MALSPCRRCGCDAAVVGFLTPFLNRAMLDFVFRLLLIWLFRTRGPIPSQAIVDRSFPPEVLVQMKAIPWWQSFGFWATLLVLCVVTLYLVFA